jgi:DNA-nicking Smr family endonuclease
MRDVVRLRADPRGRVRAAPRISARPPERRGNDPADWSGDDFAASGVSRREIKKLKGGAYVADKHLDLHGMTAPEACATVQRFIQSSRHAGHRCVCIVHGRGLHSEGNAPVLKTRVRDYLRSHPSVLAYADAPSSDGGPGAMYVLLRK